jgi:ferredoxin
MIITVAKPFAEILDAVASFKRIFVVGCAACATKCQTGGDEAVKRMMEELQKQGKEITGSLILDTPCDMRIVKKDLSRSAEANASDGLVVLACGAGVQAIEKIVDKPLIPALNPVFTGTLERIGIFHEYCSLCGDCMLAKTGGICPVTRCAKGLVNGPCGGAVEGKCEADQARDCAWALIFAKLQKTNASKTIFKEYRGPRRSAKPYDINTGSTARPDRRK